ncbi:hypothetical protein Gotri_027017, partial [Gossypium trilobum]|nr:hypothetical protein [Gossypium trilobum]
VSCDKCTITLKNLHLQLGLPVDGSVVTSHVGLPTELKDIQLLLDQQSEADFEWIPYEDPTIQVVIPDEFFVIPNAWQVKVPMVVYVTVEMHKADKVLWQFKFRQSISVAPQELNDLHREEARCRCPHTSRPRQAPLNPKSGDEGPSSASTQEPNPTSSAPSPSPHSVQLNYWLSILNVVHVWAISFPDDGDA